MRLRTSQSVRPRRRADSRPLVAPISIAMVPAMSVSSAVTASRGSNSPSTGLCVTKELPKSPRRIVPSQRRYCSQTGRSSPSLRRMVSSAAGVSSLVPADACAKSPGNARISTNATTETPSRIGSIHARRTKTMRVMRQPCPAPAMSPPAYFSNQVVRTKLRMLAASGTYPLTCLCQASQRKGYW